MVQHKTSNTTPHRNRAPPLTWASSAAAASAANCCACALTSPKTARPLQALLWHAMLSASCAMQATTRDTPGDNTAGGEAGLAAARKLFIADSTTGGSS